MKKLFFFKITLIFTFLTITPYSNRLYGAECSYSCNWPSGFSFSGKVGPGRQMISGFRKNAEGKTSRFGTEWEISKRGSYGTPTISTTFRKDSNSQINEAQIELNKDAEFFQDGKGHEAFIVRGESGNFLCPNKMNSCFPHSKKALSWLEKIPFDKALVTSEKIDGNLLNFKASPMMPLLLAVYEVSGEKKFYVMNSSIQKNVNQQEKIKNVQKKLKTLGFDPGPIDGYWGTQTKSAMQSFQKQYGLEITAELNDATIKLLEQK